ncbi:MAG: cysteine hydrolase [Neisseriaceae bacterium]|nr:cysteine hydrolase [Neisseriaceae bacterium]MBP6861176.1 cysteine hydrolase [Neisseriaceae bacterium]
MSTALLIIDVQNAFFCTPPLAHQAETVLGHINQLTERARAQATPVIWVQHHAPDLPTHSEAWALPDALCVAASDHLVSKNTPDAFLDTSLGGLLNALHVRHLVICGFATEYCVDTTTRSAMARGFHVSLVSDAHTTRDKAHASAITIMAHHNATLSSIQSFNGKTTCVAAASVQFGH